MISAPVSTGCAGSGPAFVLGTIVAVRGAVLDVDFTGATLPEICDALEVLWDRPQRLVVEVASHLDRRTVRAVALQSTNGLARGTRVRSGGPIAVPVGEAVLGRLLDVLGEVRDEGPPLATEVPRRPIHQAPPPLARQGVRAACSRPG
jgi:F-type H+-transporting ATPase subunit beta